MRAKAKFVEIGLASSVVALFGLMSALNVGVGFAVARACLATDAQAAECLGGFPASCSPTGGTNCGSSAHQCSNTGCTATSSVCTFTGTQCIMLGQLSAQSTFPCATYQSGGTCTAYSQRQCILEMWGVYSAFYSCNYGSYYCNNSSYCGEPLYLQNSSS